MAKGDPSCQLFSEKNHIACPLCALLQISNSLKAERGPHVGSEADLPPRATPSSLQTPLRRVQAHVVDGLGRNHALLTLNSEPKSSGVPRQRLLAGRAELAGGLRAGVSNKP
jgi:hypothetical protein